MTDTPKKVRDRMKNEQKNVAPFPLQRTRSIRRVYPIGYRVLVKIEPDQNQTEGGLYLPPGAKENMQESLLVEVLEVASAQDEDSGHETNVSGVPLGAQVLIPKEAGVKVPWDDTLRLVETQDVLAIVSEISVV